MASGMGSRNRYSGRSAYAAAAQTAPSATMAVFAQETGSDPSASGRALVRGLSLSNFRSTRLLNRQPAVRAAKIASSVSASLPGAGDGVAQKMAAAEKAKENAPAGFTTGNFFKSVSALVRRALTCSAVSV